MRDISDEGIAAIESGNYATAMLAEFTLDSGTYRFTSWPTTLTLDGVVWIGAGSVAKVDAIGSGIGTSARGFKVTLDGSKLTKDAPGSAFDILYSFEDEAYHNRAVAIYQAILDTQTRELIDQVQIMPGYISRADHRLKPGGEAVLEISVENMAYRFNQSDPSFRAHADQKRRSATDTFLKWVVAATTGPETWGARTNA